MPTFATTMTTTTTIVSINSNIFLNLQHEAKKGLLGIKFNIQKTTYDYTRLSI